MEFLIYNIPALTALAAGIYLCIKENKYWGWFLFAALILARFPGVS